MTEIIATLLMTHITLVCVTLYLHRSQAHRGVEFHPVIAHLMRLWLWLTTGMNTKQWVAIHRKHHRFSDEPGDPHSPHVFGIVNIVFRGVYYYYLAAKTLTPRIIVQYGRGTPSDWIEQKLYTPYTWLGIILMLVIDIVLFGVWGLVVWGVQMLWIPFWAAGIINGAGHWLGYRNYDVRDRSRNLVPWAFWICGEELHNNHHGEPGNPKMSRKWYEFDIGWMYIKILEKIGLATVRRV